LSLTIMLRCCTYWMKHVVFEVWVVIYVWVTKKKAQKEILLWQHLPFVSR
jgi:hypothetical protein